MSPHLSSFIMPVDSIHTNPDVNESDGLLFVTNNSACGMGVMEENRTFVMSTDNAEHRY